MLIVTLFIVGGYLWGAVPTAYLVSRYSKGIDIRDYGTGNVGAANVMTNVGARTGFLLGAFDCVVKGTLPVLLAKLLDQSLSVQVAVGLAAIAGHNWSLYLRFTGGRGVATAIGVVLGMFMWPEFLLLAIVLGLVGAALFRDTAFWTFLSMLALPLLAFLFSRPTEVLYMAGFIGILLIMKRLTGNWEYPSEKYSFLRVMAHRALWDRDVPRKVQWTERHPQPDIERPSTDVADQALR